MGFVKGVVTGVLAVTGAVVGAAIVCAIKEEKKERAEMQKASDLMDKMLEDDDKAHSEGMKQFDKHVGNKLKRMADLA